MDTGHRTRLGIGAALLALGLVLGLALRAGSGPGDAEWDRQVRLDAMELIKVVQVRPGDEVVLTQEFALAWEPRLALYPPERRTRLRGMLDVYLDFLLAEYADAAEIFAAGDDRVVSDVARAARAALRESFGQDAAAILADGDRLREDAYRASPVVAPGTDELPDYRILYRAVEERMPLARERVVELTTAR